MCISASASIKSFTLSIVGCILIVVLGKPYLKIYNWIFAVFFGFISFMQLIDLGIWTDLGCTTGTNKAASIIGPFLHYLQPLMAFIIPFVIINYTNDGKEYYNNKIKPIENKYPIFKLFSTTNNKQFNITHGLNILYLCYIVFMLINYFTSARTNPSLLCSQPSKTGHLIWNWINIPGSKLFLYLWQITIISALMVNFRSTYILLTLGICYALLFFTKLYKKDNISTLWCYTINIVPICLLIFQHMFPNILT